MELWKIFGWPPEKEQIIYREWAAFFAKKQCHHVAELYFDKSLALNPDDPKALYSRSQCKRRIAHYHGALADAKRALAFDETRQLFNLEVCDDIYELNEFEESALYLANFSRKFIGNKATPFNNRLDVTAENFKDTLGSTLGHFIIKYGKNFDEVYKKMVRSRRIEERPLWKILWEQKECDVLSTLEEEEVVLSPLEIARRKRAYAIFNQVYMGKNWIDVLFTKALTINRNLLLPQSNLSRPILEVLTKTKYDVVKKMTRTLHARSPLYTELLRSCPNKKMKKKATEGFLFRVQYQVHRSMFKILAHMHSLRDAGKLQKLRHFVEEVMGDYVVLKTNRVMPWKFEFVQEVYNLLALAYTDQFSIPKDLMSAAPQDRLITLLKWRPLTESEPIPYEFGNRGTFQEEGTGDAQAALDKAIVSRLMKRIHFSKHPIERAYLWHEIAWMALKKNNYDRCILDADKSFTEAKACKSNLWMLHATLLILKAHAAVRKVEKIAIALKKATQIVKKLKDDRIKKFFTLCETLNTYDIDEKKALVLMRSSKSIMSRASRSEEIK